MKDAKIIECNASITEYKKTLEKLNILKTALVDYDKDTINKTFFEKYFTSRYDKDCEYGYDVNGKTIKPKKGDIIYQFGGKEVRTDYSINKHNYDYQKEKFIGYIYISGSCQLDLVSRERLVALAEVEDKIKLVSGWQQEREEKLTQLKNFDEAEFIADIKKVYEKHGCPYYWSELLAMWDIRNFKD